MAPDVSGRRRACARRRRRGALYFSSIPRWSRRDRALDAPTIAGVWDRNSSGAAELSSARAGAIATVHRTGWFGCSPCGGCRCTGLPSYHTVVARLREEQDETRRAMGVQLATIVSARLH